MDIPTDPTATGLDRPFVVLPLLRVAFEQGPVEIIAEHEPLDLTLTRSIGPPGTYTWLRSDGALLVSGLQYTFRAGRDRRTVTAITSASGEQ